MRPIVRLECHVVDRHPIGRILQSEREADLKRARAQDLRIGRNHRGQMNGIGSGRRKRYGNQDDKE
jgi:hypothetical protein